DRDKRIIGVPTLVVEILSPSTASHDFVRKMNLYQRIGVPEYWIIDPILTSINVYRHDGERLLWMAEFKPGDTLSPSMFPDLSINVSVLFE
ncbi:MAG: Uma2 family endonuclease, partial [Acidobacteriaceae bacterium]